MKYYFASTTDDYTHVIVAASLENAKAVIRNGGLTTKPDQDIYELTPNKFDSEGFLVSMK